MADLMVEGLPAAWNAVATSALMLGRCAAVHTTCPSHNQAPMLQGCSMQCGWAALLLQTQGNGVVTALPNTGDT